MIKSRCITAPKKAFVQKSVSLFQSYMNDNKTRAWQIPHGTLLQSLTPSAAVSIRQTEPEVGSGRLVLLISGRLILTGLTVTQVIHHVISRTDGCSGTASERQCAERTTSGARRRSNT